MNASNMHMMPHVVIVERPEGIRLVEFDEGSKPSPGEAAQAYAMSLPSREFFGRIIVAMRLSQIQPMTYIKACADAKKSNA